MIFILQLLLSSVYVLVILLTLEKRQKKVVLNLCNIFKLSFAVMFGVAFPVCYVLSYYGFNYGNMGQYITQYDFYTVSVYYIYLSLVTIAFLSILKIGSRALVLTEPTNENYSFDYNNGIGAIAIIMFIIGIISDYLYLRAYGSYANYLMYSGAIRSGVINVNNPFSFLIVFRSCIEFSSYLFLSQTRKNGKTNYNNIFLFVLSFFLSLRVLYSNRGRLDLLVYLLVILLFVIQRRRMINRIDLRLITRMTVLGILFIYGVYLVGIILNRNTTENIITQFNKEISFVFVNFIVLIKKMSASDFRWFIDILLFPIYLLPASIWQTKLGITTASSDLTLLVAGFRKGEGGIHGEMPTDLLSLSYMQSGFIGIIILPIVYALLFTILYKTINKISNKEIRSMVSLYAIVECGVESLYYADPQHIVYRCFALIVFLIIGSVLSKVTIRRS